MSKVYILQMDTASPNLDTDQLAVINKVFSVSIGVNNTFILTLKAVYKDLMNSFLKYKDEFDKITCSLDIILSARLNSVLDVASEKDYNVEIESDGVMTTIYFVDKTTKDKVSFTSVPVGVTYSTGVDAKIADIITYLKACVNVIGIQAVTTTVIK